MIEGAAEAIAAACAIGVAAIAARWVPRLRPWAPEVWVVAALVTAAVLGLHPVGGARAAAWQAVLVQPAIAALVLLALFQTRLRAIVEPTPINALLGGMLFGWLPTVALMSPAAGSPRDAARLALVATAGAAASPLGGPVQLLVANGEAWWSLWAAVPALAAAAVVWPWSRSSARVAWPIGPVVSGAVGAVVAWVAGGLAGITVASAGMLFTTRRPDEPAPWGLERSAALRWAAGAHLAASFCHLAGVAWFGAYALDFTLGLDQGLPLAAAGAALGALLVDPMVGVTVLERITTSSIGLAPEGRYALALPIALTPVPALALAAMHHGRGVWRAGLPLGAVQIALAVAWAALVT